LWTENQLGEKIQVKELETEKDEAIFVVGQIKKALLNSEYREKPDYSEMAIFYRNNYQSRPLEDALRNAKLPYKIIGGIKFYERKEIKDVIAYLRLIINPDDSLALSRIINVPSRGIGATTLKKLEEMASQLNVSLWIAIERVQTNSDQFGLKLSGKIKSSLTTFYNFVSECMLLHKSGNSTYTIFEKVIHESGYIEELKSIKDYESEARLENIYELGQAIKDFSESHPNSTVTDFIETIALDTSVTQEGLENQGEISLMTVHGAKGLEFHNVFVVGMEEGIFPSMKSIESGSMALEEERRLCYVAMTRSMKNLWMTFPRARYQWGQLKFNGPSRFLFELPKDKIIWDHKGSSSLDLNSNKNFDDFDFNQSYDDDAVKIYNGKSNNLVDIASKGALSKNFTVTKPSLNLPESKYKKGNVVHHSVYGKGTVVDTEGAGANEKVLILFPDGAKKRFLVKYAPITLEKN